ncbi:hypothetical protein BaRGS_00009843, partial [Batillaria attramentaria]
IQFSVLLSSPSLQLKVTDHRREGQAMTCVFLLSASHCKTVLTCLLSSSCGKRAEETGVNAFLGLVSKLGFTPAQTTTGRLAHVLITSTPATDMF